MNRRNAIQSFFASAAALLVAKPAAAKPEELCLKVSAVLDWRPENIIDPRRFIQEKRQRCLLDGQDVTFDTVLALPGERGWIVRLKRDPATGRRIVQNGHVARETILGKVEIR